VKDAEFPTLFMIGKIFESNNSAVLATVFESYEDFSVLQLVFPSPEAARQFGRTSLEVGESRSEWMLAIGGGGPLGRELAVVFSGGLEAKQPTLMNLVEENGQRHELALLLIETQEI
jgi:hypothetical protein